MQTNCLDIRNADSLKIAADLLAQGEVIVVYFNGAYAFLCDADQTAPAQKIFALKKRPLSQTLSLVVDPIYLSDFVDLAHPAFRHFPLVRSITLQRQAHALGIIYPAKLATVPADIIQADSILNVWTEYEAAKRPFAQLMALIRDRGLRGCKGASTNLSSEPTYHSLEQVLKQFNGRLPLILDNPQRTPLARRKSTTILDLTGTSPTLVREGNVPAAELQHHLDQVGFGKLTIAANIKRL